MDGMLLFWFETEINIKCQTRDDLSGSGSFLIFSRRLGVKLHSFFSCVTFSLFVSFFMQLIPGPRSFHLQIFTQGEMIEKESVSFFAIEDTYLLIWWPLKSKSTSSYDDD